MLITIEKFNGSLIQYSTCWIYIAICIACKLSPEYKGQAVYLHKKANQAKYSAYPKLRHFNSLSRTLNWLKSMSVQNLGSSLWSEQNWRERSIRGCDDHQLSMPPHFSPFFWPKPCWTADTQFLAVFFVLFIFCKREARSFLKFLLFAFSFLHLEHL